jgi:DNA-directed RNA polymerase specialized sigma24 family protein
MIDSVSEEDDTVQETWLRLSRTDTSSAENLGGWLTKVVGLAG